jgi:hypothetical protein
VLTYTVTCQMEITFSMEQYEIDIRDSEIIDKYVKFDRRIVQ